MVKIEKSKSSEFEESEEDVDNRRFLVKNPFSEDCKDAEHREDFVVVVRMTDRRRMDNESSSMDRDFL